MPSEPHALRAEPSPVVPLPGRAHHPPLPAPLSSLIGRDIEAATAASLVRDPATRLVTLTGPGGVGKTRLALRVAADAEPAFADGVVFVDLTPVRDPELVVPAIAQALGVRRVDDRPALAALMDALQHRHTLLVIDNFEQVIAAAASVADLLRACSRITALVTSRALLYLSGERVVPVPPLTVPRGEKHSASTRHLLGYEAVRLFVERSQAVQPGFTLTADNAQAVAELCARLDGLPLAIEMAAARSALFPPEALLARLERRLPLLTAAPRDLPDRQRTMRDTIAWSYDLLNPPEQAVLRRLAVFVGGCDIEAAEYVCADPDLPAGYAFDTMIESLIRQSLVQVTASTGAGSMPRLTLLETVREFAIEALVASEEAMAVRRRHAEHELAVARRAEPTFWGDTPGDWRAIIGAERGNLHAALAWAMTHGETDLALQLASALFDPFAMSDAYRITGEDLRGQQAALRRALDLPGGSAANRAIATGRLAWLTEALGETAESQALAARTMALAREAGDEMALATTTFVQGRFALRAGNLAEARRLLTDALNLFRALHADGRVAWTLCSLASVDSRAAIAGGDAAGIARAAARCDEALATFRANGHLPGITRVLFELAQLAYHQRDLARSCSLLQELLTMAWEHRQMVHPYLDDIARVAIQVDQPDVAARLFGAAIEERRRDGTSISPIYREQVDRDMEAVRHALGEAAFAEALAAGQALPLEQAVAEALAFTAAGAAAPTVTLTPREAEVLPLLVDGMTAREIGKTLYLSHRTIEHHIASIYAKLGIRARAELPDAARAAGLIAPPLDDSPASRREPFG